MLHFVLIILFVSLLTMFGHKKYGDSYRSFKYVLFVLIIFCGIRDPFSLPDMPNYYDHFYGRAMPSIEGENFNTGYIVFETVMNKLTLGSFNMFSFVITMIITGGYGWFIRKHSPYIMISLLLYVLVAYFYSFFLLRQYIAIIFGLVAFQNVLERNHKRFLFWTFLAVSFHSSAIIILPVYYLQKLEFGNKTPWVLVGISIGLIVSFKILANYLFAGHEYYSHYLGTDEETPYVRLAMKVFILLVFVIALGRNCYQTGLNRLLFICLLFNIIIYAGTQGIFGAYRLRAYFEISEIIGIPVILQALTNSKRFKRVIVQSMTFVYFVLLYYSAINFLLSDSFSQGYITIFD